MDTAEARVSDLEGRSTEKVQMEHRQRKRLGTQETPDGADRKDLPKQKGQRESKGGHIITSCLWSRMTERHGRGDSHLP